jgi:hypothetical protein
MTIEKHFDEDTWANLPTFFDQLPEPVQIHIWGDPENFPIEREAVRLVQTLSERFEGIRYRLFPRRENYPYYPGIGVMGLEEDEPGATVAQTIFNMAVASPRIRSFLVIADAFPQAFVRNSINEVPHLIINGRSHIEGIIDEEEILNHISRTIRL